MPSKEIPLQHGFDGELVDTRTTKQKAKARQRQAPQQAPMFSSRQDIELMKTRVRQHSHRTRSGKPLEMALMMEDPRTEEEIDEQRIRAAQEQTYAMFGRGTGPKSRIFPPLIESELKYKTFPSGKRLPLRQVEELNGAWVVQLSLQMELEYWCSRDEALDKAQDSYHHGYKAYPVDRHQMEVYSIKNQSGYYLITYSSMCFIENIEWKTENHGFN